MKLEHLKRQYHWIFSDNVLLGVDEGWTWLLSGLCYQLEQRDSGVLITAVVQRLGTLSIAFLGDDPPAASMISAVELASNQVCQLCASTKEVGATFGPTIFTLCRYCWQEDERFAVHHLSPNQISETASAKMEVGLLAMEDGWFKTRLLKLIGFSK